MQHAVVALVLIVAGGGLDQAQAQGKFVAEYAITMAHIAVGKGTWTADIGPEQYTATASGSASGIFSVLVSGQGSITTRGVVKDGRLQPLVFTSKINSDDGKTDLQMRFENGNVAELVAEAATDAAERVPVTEAHRQGVLDPLSALLIPAGGAGDVLAADACRRTLPIFDGRRRYNLQLAFKRADKVKAAKGYQGPVVVCSLGFQPIAGHRATSMLVKYLSQGRDIELWLAPIAGTRILAPFRLSVTNLIGNIVIDAGRFETLAQTAPKAP